MSFKDGKFGILTIRHAVTPDIFYCDCKCGNELEVWRSLLANRVQLDCGMCRQTRGKIFNASVHGHTRTVFKNGNRKNRRATNEYNSYSSMIARCYNLNHQSYADYGGRNIRVCNRWREPRGRGIKNFIDDMGPRPVGTTLDRINPQGHYEPTNCRWATAKVQYENRRCMLWPKGGKIKMPKREPIEAMEARIAEFDAELNPC